MKIWIGVFYIFIGLLSCKIAAAETNFGVCQFGKETIAEVVCYGPTVLKDTIVTNKVKVAGPLDSDGVTITNLEVAGSADLTNTTVMEDAEIKGTLSATRSEFKKNVLLTGDKAELYRSSIKGSITIESKFAKPYLILECGAYIVGDVIFKTTKGVLQINDDSLVQGKIVNGDTEFIRVKCK